MKNLSVVVPFYNEGELVVEVLSEIRRALPNAEIVAVDDGSSDGTADRIKSIPSVKLLSFQKNCGQSAAIYAGLHAASGEIIAMMDGDGQNDPSDILKLIQEMSQADVVYGVRKDRKDAFARLISSRIANAIRRFVLGDKASDTGCTLKIIRREHVKYLIPFNGLHRYLPALFERAGLSFAEVAVNHRARKAGISKYTINGRALRGIFDLIGVRWLMSRMIIWP
ncbi:MAG: glycosyltransferase family 2 protein [bacterium]